MPGGTVPGRRGIPPPGGPGGPGGINPPGSSPSPGGTEKWGIWMTISDVLECRCVEHTRSSGQTIQVVAKLINASRNTTKFCLTVFHIVAQPLIQRVHIPHQLALLFQRGQVHESIFLFEVRLSCFPNRSAGERTRTIAIISLKIGGRMTD